MTKAPFYVSVLLLLIVVISSCGTSNSATKEIYSSRFEYSYDTIYRSYNGDFSQNYTGGIDLHWVDSITYVVYNYCGSNQLKVLDFQTDSILELPLFNPGCKQVYSEIYGNDLYLLTPDGKVWLYCDRTTHTELVCDLSINTSFKNTGLVLSDYKPGGDQHINVPNSVLYFNLRQDYELTTGKYSKWKSGYPTFAKLNLTDNTVQVFGKEPTYISNGQYGLISTQFSLYFGNSIIVSNQCNGEITIINTIENVTKTTTEKSRFDTVAIKKFRRWMYRSNRTSEKFKHGMLAPCYESLFYNPYTKRYYRIFHPEMPEYNSEGLLNTEFDKKCVLMVFDENLKLIDEVLLPLKRQQTLKLFPLKDGVAIYLPELFKVEGTTGMTFSYLGIHHK